MTDKEHEARHDIGVVTNTPFLHPINSSPSSSPSRVDLSDANASPTCNASPALGVSASDDHPPSLAASSADALSVVSTPSYLVADQTFPAYFTQEILAHLKGVSQASAWQDLLSAFLQFERASPPSGVKYFFSLKYTTMLTLPLQKLPTSARPPEVAQWIKRHVNKKHDPVTVSTDYPSRFVAWWNAIQPAWRIKPNGLLSREAPAREAWTSLKKGGSAGLYVVVMALSWWICKLEAGSDELRAWDIVDDVTWVLSSVMLAPPPSGVKRALPDAADAESDDGSPPSKCVSITTSRLTYFNFSFLRRVKA